MSYLDTELRNIINVIEINESEIAVEVSNPIFSVRNSYGVSFHLLLHLILPIVIKIELF